MFAQIPQSKIQKGKIAIYIALALLIFIGGCITIAVFTKGSTGGASKYYFALCFCTAPFLVYQVMTPLWTRTVKFANAYAFAVIDILLSIFWFAAFVSVAAWTTAGIHKGAKEANIDSGKGNCTTFKYGSKGMCDDSYAAMGVGIVIFLLFAATAGISVMTVLKYRKEGTLPWDATTGYANPSSLEAQQKTNDAWSADTHDIDEQSHYSQDQDQAESSSALGTRPPPGRQDDQYGLLNSHETEEGHHPGHPLNWGQQNQESAPPYGAPYPDQNNTTPYPVGPTDYRAPDALSPGGYDEYRAGGRNYGFSN